MSETFVAVVCFVVRSFFLSWVRHCGEYSLTARPVEPKIANGPNPAELKPS